MTANTFNINRWLDAVVENVRKLAEEHPERVYSKGEMGGCTYSPDDRNPDGCIVGAAARMLDDPDQWLDYLDEQGSMRVGIAVETLCLDFGEVPLSSPEDPRIEWLEHVQGEQDGRRPWGTAVGVANDSVPFVEED